MKKSIVYSLHAGLWLCYFLLIIMILGVLFQHNEDEKRIEYFWSVYCWFALFPSAMAFYAFYFFLFPVYFQKKKFVHSIIYGILIALGIAVLANSTTYMFKHDSVYGEDTTPDIVSISIIFFIALASGVVSLVLKGFISWFDEVKSREMLTQKNHEMEMALVKSQLDPHFLFNTINNIDALILKDAARASGYLNNLSDIIRFMLYEAKPDSILLEKEIRYIEKYIELQRIRTSNSNYVTFSVSGHPGNKIIAPMIFIPFIENAFKHAASKKLADAITIRIDIHDTCIHFACANKFNTKKQEEENGLGNDLIQKRLTLIYPDKHTLKITRDNNLYDVDLTIKYG